MSVTWQVMGGAKEVALPDGEVGEASTDACRSSLAPSWGLFLVRCPFWFFFFPSARLLGQ